MKRTLFQAVGRHGRIRIGTALALVLFLQAPTWVLARQNVGARSNHLPRTCQSIKRGGTFTYGVDQDVISFDAANTQDNGSLWADLNIYDQLVRLTPDASRVAPDLAQSWNIQNGGRVFIFHLRHDARFYNGDPVTAADVKFSWDRTRSPKSVVNWTLQAVKSDQALGRYTFKVVLKKPWAPFLNDISLWGASIMSKKAVLTEGAAGIKTHPVGSGPFYVAKWLPGQYILLKRNPYYWEKDACGHQYPYLNAVKLVYTPNDNTRMLKLESGSLDAAIDVPYNQIASINSMPGLRAETTPQFGTVGIALNQDVAPLRDPKVRQAMNYAIDRNAIVRAVFFGHAQPALSPIDQGLYCFTGTYGYHYDLTKAKQIMAQSKYPHGFKVTLLTISGDSIGAAIAVIMQSELKKIGVQMSIQPLDSTTQFEMQQKRKFQLAYGYGTSDNLDPNANMLFCCVKNGGADSGYTSWHNTLADRLFSQTQTAMNFSRRCSLFNTWQKIIMQQGPYVWVVQPTNRFGYHTYVHDFFVQKTAHWPLWVVWKT